MTRKAIPDTTRRSVLAEAGYRCAVPTCRTILALDLHHIEEVQNGGTNDVWNLIALCPTCHALYTRGTITRDAITSWKAMLVALNQAFDQEAITNLLFLRQLDESRQELDVSGDGVLKFSSLIAAGLADFALVSSNGPLRLYRVALSMKGRMIVDAWRSGDRGAVEAALKP